MRLHMQKIHGDYSEQKITRDFSDPTIIPTKDFLLQPNDFFPPVST